MKHVHKGTVPPELTRWSLDRAGAPAAWEDLPAEVGAAIKRELLAEPGHLCCYCGRRIVPSDYHIEHLVPRHGAAGNASLTFVHENLLASCQANLGRKDPRHCGTSKSDWYDPILMVSPLNPGCERRFRYDIDGKVRESDPADQGAKATIAHLDLDGAHLRTLRRNAIEGLDLDLTLDLTPEERHTLLAAHEARDADGRFESFCFVLAVALRSLYEEAIDREM